MKCVPGHSGVSFNIWLLKSRAPVTGDRPRKWGGVSVRVSALLLCSNPPPSCPGLWGPHRHVPTMRATLPGPRYPNFGTKHTSCGGRVLREIPVGVREFCCKHSKLFLISDELLEAPYLMI